MSAPPEAHKIVRQGEYPSPIQHVLSNLKYKALHSAPMSSNKKVNKHQAAYLRGFGKYVCNNYPNVSQIEELSQTLNISTKRVDSFFKYERWFIKKRAREAEERLRKEANPEIPVQKDKEQDKESSMEIQSGKNQK